MEKIDLLMWMMGAGFAINFSILKALFTKIEKLDEKVTDIDRRLCRIEGAMASKECCVLKEDRLQKKVE